MWHNTPRGDHCRKGAVLLGGDYQKYPGQICLQDISGEFSSIPSTERIKDIPCDYYYYIKDGNKYKWKKSMFSSDCVKSETPCTNSDKVGGGKRKRKSRRNKGKSHRKKSRHVKKRKSMRRAKTRKNKSRRSRRRR